MAIPAAAVILPLGVLFLLSGLIVNLIQAIFFVIVRPYSKNGYRRINRMLAELLWIELVWIVDWWAGVKVQVYADSETLEMMGKEHALVIANHKSDIDWLIGWVFAQRYDCLGSALAIMKKSSKLLPVIGWSMWFSEYLFLERSWAKDENTLKIGLQQLKDYPRPFWLALFVEGTRFTQAKLVAAQEYASSNGLPVPRNVLIPRTKGFVTSVSQMRSFVPAIYDMTVAIPRNTTPPTMLRLFKGQPSVVSSLEILLTGSALTVGERVKTGWLHVKMKRHLMKDLPETDEAVAQWCKDLFVAKDDLLDKHKAEDTFPDSEIYDIGRPLRSLMVVTSWSCLLVLGTYKFFQWSDLFSSWKGLTITAFCLAVITVLMQILIQFSQSERSTPAKVAPSRTNNGEESSSSDVHNKQE